MWQDHLCMRKLVLFCLLLTACSSPHSHRLAVCAIFKNEAPWLKEWLTYHREALGVSHFYLYNNESSDHYHAVLQPWVDQGVVELIDWDSSDPSHFAQGPFMDAPWSAAQLGAYNDCLKHRALGKAQWVAMIDIDEFIVPAKGAKSLYALLDQAKKKGKGTVSLHWRVFGTSEVADVSEGEWLTHKLLWRSQDDHPWNQLVKSIHRPEAVVFCLVHVAEKLKPHYGAKTLRPDQVSLHHYWTRTEQYCLEKRNKSKELDPPFFEALHQVEDRTILQYF